jgi:hypothetical protein
MQNQLGFNLSAIAVTAALLLAPGLATAQTPEPAAGNPAIDNTPKPSTGDAVTSGMDNAAGPSMASPSNEANIPKCSNPNGGSGNLSAGSGATPSSTASDNSMPSQTGQNPQSSVNDSRPSQTAANPNADMSNSGSEQSSSPASGPMPQGKYASPPTTDAE